MTTREPEHRLESIHKQFWRGHSKDGWFSATRDRVDDRPAHVETTLEQIRDLVEALGIRHVCEFGTGNGKFLHLLRKRFGPSLSYTGIDICADQIDANRRTYSGMEFVAADVCEWVDLNPSDNTLYLTYGGVLEYLCRSSVQRLFASIAQRSHNSLVALLIEPLGSDHDLQAETRSMTYGGEYSFSHNYPFLLKSAGLEVVQNIELDYLCRRVTVLATNGVNRKQEPAQLQADEAVPA